MFGRNALHEFIRQQREEARREHEETMDYLQRRDEEMKQRDAEMKEEMKRRDAEMRDFNREILLRNEKVYTAAIAQLEKNTARVESNTEETRAQTQALLKLIDRFDNPGNAAAA
jgi:hypothetical protein